MAGCGGGPDTDRLEDGRAEGVGFTFELSDDWRALSDLEELRREVGESARDEVKGADLEAGLAFAGAWVNQDDDRRPVVNVVVEPVTRDTELAVYGASSVAVLTTAGRDVGPPRRTRLAGEPAAVVAYSSKRKGETVDTRQVFVKRGDYGYTLTVQTRTDDPTDARELLEDVTATWRWVPPTAAGRRTLAGVSDFTGTYYSVTLPPGWRGTRREALNDQEAFAGADSLWRGWIGEEGATSVTVTSTGSQLEELEDALVHVEERETETLARQADSLSIRRGPRLEVGGAPAGSLDISMTIGGQELRQLEVVAFHSPGYWQIKLSGPASRHGRDRRAFMRALETWTFEPFVEP